MLRIPILILPPSAAITMLIHPPTEEPVHTLLSNSLAMPPPLSSPHSLRPIRNPLLLLTGPPLLDKRQESRLPGDILLQHLGNIEALGGLEVFEQAAEGALGGAEGAVEGVDVFFARGGLFLYTCGGWLDRQGWEGREWGVKKGHTETNLKLAGLVVCAV